MSKGKVVVISQVRDTDLLKTVHDDSIGLIMELAPGSEIRETSLRVLKTRQNGGKRFHFRADLRISAEGKEHSTSADLNWVVSAQGSSCRYWVSVVTGGYVRGVTYGVSVKKGIRSYRDQKQQALVATA